MGETGLDRLKETTSPRTLHENFETCLYRKSLKDFKQEGIIRFVFENVLSDDSLENTIEDSKILHKKTKCTVERPL